MTRKLAFIFITATLLASIATLLPAHKVSADAICFFPTADGKLSPAPCSTSKALGTNPQIIKDNKCYTYQSDKSWVESDCKNPSRAKSPDKVGRAGFLSNTCGNTDSGLSCIQGYINIAVNILSAGVGLIVTVMIIIGGIQYSSAGGDPQKVAEARKKILNALLALVAFIFLYAVMNWLIPGGLL